ncbi:unnamed protein product [Linum tenue]|uniref:Alpha/beta hydrolase fold-3 domain-containing protein n=1 Tax=Linum tenue TaxID=586396 RepID=A0AAV0RKP4_9ROSI|nr:unnamed protein product [Linum tenue]
MASSDSNQRKIVTEFPGTIRVYDDGTVERLRDTDFVPPSISVGGGGVSSNFSARLYLPPHCHRKLPLLLYFHGGAFCISSPFCGKYHRYVSRLAAEARVVVVSFAYRLAPEHPIPAAYDDARAGIRWAVSHRAGNGPEPWSAGGNIVHNLAMAVGDPEFGLGVGLSGIALVCPYFSGSKPTESEVIHRRPGGGNMWAFVCPSSPDNDDPRINPVGPKAPSLMGLGSKRVMVIVAGEDGLRDRGRLYYEGVEKSGWKGGAEFVEIEGEGHCFHLYNLESEKAGILIKRLVAFFNGKS